MNKAVFLDRDGVLNRERGEYTYLEKDFELNEGVIEALRIFRDKGYLLVVITNQSGIAKGVYSLDQLEKINHLLTELLGNEGISLTEIYYCPHHPDKSRCLCRKPGSLLLEKALARFSIDPDRSYFIGDAERDIVAGSAAGVKTIRIEPNSNLLNIAQQIL
jgi:D-glycero-D-manno-heptose 1,7-bisphosphate phosphatase